MNIGDPCKVFLDGKYVGAFGKIKGFMSGGRVVVKITIAPEDDDYSGEIIAGDELVMWDNEVHPV